MESQWVTALSSWGYDEPDYVELGMRRAGLQVYSGWPRFRCIPNVATASDLADRQFQRSEPDRLWVTDITEHRTREAKVYCAVVFDVFSRRVVGWSIRLVTDRGASDERARDSDRSTSTGRRIDSDPFGPGKPIHLKPSPRRAVDSGLLPSMGPIGDCYNNALIESFWSRIQIELFDRQRRRTRAELTNAIFDYLETFHNPQQRHSTLSMITPIEFEARNQPTTAA